MHIIRLLNSNLSQLLKYWNKIFPMRLFSLTQNSNTAINA